MQGISWLAGFLLASQEGLCSVWLVITELHPAQSEGSPLSLRKWELLWCSQSEETEHLCSVYVLCTLRKFCCGIVSRDWTSLFCLCSVYIEKVLLWYCIKRLNICVLFMFCVRSEGFVVILYQETEHLCSVYVLCTFRKFCCGIVSRDWTFVFCSCSVYVQKILLCYSIKQRKSLRVRARSWDPQTESVECPAVQFEGK